MSGLPLAVVAALLMAGCGGVGDIHMEASPVAQNLFRFTDARPAEDRLTRTERVGATLVRHLLGDDRVHPSFPAMLESRLLLAKGEALKGRSVEVRKAAVRVYEKTGMDRTGEPDRRVFIPQGTQPAYAGAGIVLADLMELGFSEKRIEIELEGTVDGQPVSASEYGSYTFGSPEKAVLELMDKTLAGFADKIR